VSDDLDQLADEFWEETLRFQPTYRHMLGDYSDVGSWEHASSEAEQAHAAALRGLVARAEAVDPTTLDDDDSERLRCTGLSFPSRAKREMSGPITPETLGEPINHATLQRPVRRLVFRWPKIVGDCNRTSRVWNLRDAMNPPVRLPYS